MSAVAVMQRIAQIEALTARAMPPAPPAPQASAAPSFAAELRSAHAPTGPAPTATSAGSGRGVPFGDEIDQAARRHRVDPALLTALVRQESGFRPDAVSSAGARGLTQLMPATAREVGVSDPSDPRQALDGGALYLRRMLDRFGGDEKLALAAYNAGPGAVSRYGGIPPYAETQRYVTNVMAYADQYRGRDR